MPNRSGHRRFGNVRKRESGRFQIRYPGPDGRMRTGPDTYERKSDAERALTLIEAAMMAGEWTDPERGKVKLGDPTVQDFAFLYSGHRQPTGFVACLIAARKNSPSAV